MKAKRSKKAQKLLKNEESGRELIKEIIMKDIRRRKPNGN